MKYITYLFFILIGFSVGLFYSITKKASKNKVITNRACSQKPEKSPQTKTNQNIVKPNYVAETQTFLR